MAESSSLFSRIDVDESIGKSGNKNREIIDYINANYEILIPVQDPEKIQINYKGEDEDRYRYSPSFEDLTLHLEESGFNISDGKLWKMITSPNYIDPFDPVKDYFDRIRGTFNGESHIDLLCQHITPRSFEDNMPEYYQQRTVYLIRKWLVASVACWIDGKPNSVCLGLISGKGGLGKTTMFRFLLPEALQEYYIQPSKDERIFNMEASYVRYMMVNFEELEGINKSTINTFKKVQTDPKILTKSRNERVATNKKRLACSVFSSNCNSEMGGFIQPYFGDTRRFGAIEITHIDHQYSNVVDVDQLWAEALNLYENTEFDYVFDMNDFDDFNHYNMRYVSESLAMYYIQQHLNHPSDDNDGEKLNASAILKRLVDNKHIRNEDLGPNNKLVNIRTLGYALASLGYQYGSYRDETNMPLKGWHVKFN